MPPVVKRLGWWYVGPLLVIPASMLVFVWPGGTRMLVAGGLWAALLMPAAISTPTFIAMAMVLRGLNRIKRAVQATEGHSCLGCMYDLRGLGDTGICPECGHLFCIDQDRKTWTAAGCQYNLALYKSRGPTFAPIPPAVKRQLWWLALPALLLAAAVTALLVFNLGNSASLPSDTETLLYAAAILAAFVLAIAVSTRRQRHGLRAPKASAARACVVCNHDLSHLPATGTCPTCNRPFDTVADQCSWARVKMLK